MFLDSELRKRRDFSRSAALDQAVAKELFTLYADKGFALKGDVAAYCFFDGLGRLGLDVSHDDYWGIFVVQGPHVLVPLDAEGVLKHKPSGDYVKSSSLYFADFMRSVGHSFSGARRAAVARELPVLLQPHVLLMGFESSVADYLFSLQEEALILPNRSLRFEKAPTLLDEVRSTAAYRLHLGASDEEASWSRVELVADYLSLLYERSELGLPDEAALLRQGAKAFPSLSLVPSYVRRSP